MSNHHQILSDTLYKQFEIPLLQHLDTHKANIEASEAQYERSMRDMSQAARAKTANPPPSLRMVVPGVMGWDCSVSALALR